MHKTGVPLQPVQACQTRYEHTITLIDREVVQSNEGDRQGYGLSPVLFNIYNDDVIRTWKSSMASRIPLNMNINVNT